MKIYTKKGDGGETSLFGGQRVAKSSLRIDAYGNIDELNSLLGVILAKNKHKEISQNLIRVQRHLFVLGADLATPKEVKVKVPRIKSSTVKVLEKEMDNWTKVLPQLRNFILPGGSEIGAFLHSARTICRRSERTVVALSEIEPINQVAVIYLNRLSDWLFTLARYVNKLEKIKETPWKGRG